MNGEQTYSQGRGRQNGTAKQGIPIQDRREYPRLSEAIPIILRGRNVDAYTFSVNVGSGGVRFLWDEPMVIGETYRLSMNLKTLRVWLHLKAEAVWEKNLNGKRDVGMKFVGIDEDQRSKLDEYLRQVTAVAEKQSFAYVALPERRRRFARVSRLFMTTLQSEDKPGEKKSGLILDLSLGGARLLINREIAENKMLKVTIEFEKNEPISFVSRVAWCDHSQALKKFKKEFEYVMAVEFLDYSEDARDILKAYLSYKNTMKEASLVQTLLEMAGKAS